MLLHETIRKRICRAAYVVCCLVPTLAVVLAIGFYHRPWRSQDEAQNLSQRLHLQVAFAGCWQPRPGVTDYRAIEFSDLRTGAPLLSADCVRVDRRQQRVAVTVDRLDLPSSDFMSLARVLETWIASASLPNIDIQAKQIVLHKHPSLSQSPDKQQPAERYELRLRNLQVHSRPNTENDRLESCRFWFQADVTADNHNSPIRLIIERMTEDDAPVLRATLDTRSASLPGWVLGRIVPGDALFEAGQFSGVVRAESHRHFARGSLRGQLEDFNLRQFLPNGSPHDLQGQALINWEHLAWQDQRVESAQGNLQAVDGLASASLLEAAEEMLHCEPAGKGTEEKSFQFDQLACRFRLNEAGLTIWGECPVEEDLVSGCLLSYRGNPLLLQPKYVELPIAQLVRLVAPLARGWLPATQEAQRIAQALPLPRRTASAPAAHGEKSTIR